MKQFQDISDHYTFFVGYSDDGAWAGIVYEIGLYQSVWTSLVIKSLFDDCIFIAYWNDGLNCVDICKIDDQSLTIEGCTTNTNWNEKIVFDLPNSTTY